MIIAQVAAVAADIGVDAVKVGMLGDGADDRGRASRPWRCSGAPVVVDPVMVAESGAVLLEPGARGA